MTSPLSIELPKWYYSTGEKVVGNIIFNPKGDRKIHGIHIHFVGSEFCENHFLADLPFQKKWILDGSTTVFGKTCAINRKGHSTLNHSHENDGILIKAGAYSWPFSFQIPKNIPPSCEYKNGRVKIVYILTAIVDIPWSKSMKCSKNIRIGLPYIIDLEKDPIIIRGQKSFLIRHSVGYIPGRSMNLRLEAYVNKPITFSGDTLTVYFSVDNNSGRRVQSIKCKLKQTWIYGHGYFEKYTLCKFKHKNENFPLDQGIYKNTIPLVIPNCDLKPTITNASVVKCTYYITLIARIRASINLRIRIPIILASYPPLIKSDIENKEKGLEEKKEISMPNLINWDETVPEQKQIEPPLIPEINESMLDNKSNQFEITEEYFEKIKPSEIEMNEMEFSKNIMIITDTINELESSIHWANTGQLHEILDTNSLNTIDNSLKDLLNATKSVLNATSKLVEVCKNGSIKDYLNSLKDFSNYINNLSLNSKISSSQLHVPNLQKEILQKAKDISVASQQLAMSSKNFSIYDPLSTSNSVETLEKILQNAVKSVENNCLNLANIVKQTFETIAERIKELNLIKNQLEKILNNFLNPFGNNYINISFEKIIIDSQACMENISQFMTCCYSSYLEINQISKNILISSEQLMLNVGGISKTYPTIMEKIVSLTKKSIDYTIKLLDNGIILLNQGNLSNPINIEPDLKNFSQFSIQNLNSIINLINDIIKQKEKDIEKEIEQHIEKEKEKYLKELEEKKRRNLEIETNRKKEIEQEKKNLLLEEQANYELVKAVQNISKITKKLMEIKPIIEKKELLTKDDCFIDHKIHVVNATDFVANSISQLLKAAQIAQEERKKLLKDKTDIPTKVYHKDPKWTKGLISAAKHIVDLIEQLVSFINDNNLDEDIIVSLAHSINASTAQLLSAQRVKGIPGSEAYQMILRASKMVALSTSELISIAKEVMIKKNIEEDNNKKKEILSSSPTLISEKMKELEVAVKISKLEKELIEARNEMFTIRKEKYTSSPNNLDENRKNNKPIS